MKKSGICSFDLKSQEFALLTYKQEKVRKKSGKNQKVRKKTKSSNIFQIVWCISFIIVFVTLGFLIQRIEIVNRTGCISRHFQNKCLFIFIYLNLTIWWLLRWMLCVDRIFSYSRYNTANEKVSKFNWYSQEKVRKKSGNFILRCVWEPCHYLLQEIIQTVIKLW